MILITLTIPTLTVITTTFITTIAHGIITLIGTITTILMLRK